MTFAAFSLSEHFVPYSCSVTRPGPFETGGGGARTTSVESGRKCRAAVVAMGSGSGKCQLDRPLSGPPKPRSDFHPTSPVESCPVKSSSAPDTRALPRRPLLAHQRHRMIPGCPVSFDSGY